MSGYGLQPGLAIGSSDLHSREAQWIWSPEHPRGAAPAGDCYFRKTLQVTAVEQASITITADDRYELWINGRRIGNGQSIRQMENYDISRLLVNGKNVIGVKVTNVAEGRRRSVRVMVKPSWELANLLD